MATQIYAENFCVNQCYHQRKSDSNNMARTKKSVSRRQRKKKLIKQAKGYKWGRKSKYRAAKEALIKAGTHAYKDRKRKKRDFRKLWQIRINAALKGPTLGSRDRANGISYSRFINGLKKNNIVIDRKILAELALNYPDIFKKITEEVKQG